MKISYINKRFNTKSRALIQKANDIIESYTKQGYYLTLRQLYYVFVSQNIIANNQKEYKNLGNVLNDARLAGLVSWTAIEDRTRNLQALATWDSPASIISACASQFKHDLWADQPNYVEVWFEKEALIGVAEKICDELRVPYFACRGYNSASEQWRAGQRLKSKVENGQKVHILHFGDHDPSGVDMTSDNRDRLQLFLGEHAEDFKFHRMALNMEQVEKYRPPPNPAKPKDSRYNKYVKKFGTKKCWELDALEPKIISGIIRAKVKRLRDEKKWAKSLKRERASILRVEELAEIA